MYLTDVLSNNKPANGKSIGNIKYITTIIHIKKVIKLTFLALESITNSSSSYSYFLIILGDKNL